jgi:hypothetical protein
MLPLTPQSQVLFSSKSARWELNPRPASYKDAALTVELRASESRAGGNRTHSGRLKVCCAAFTPRPHKVGRAYAFQSPSARHRFLPWCFMFSGSPEDRTQRDPVISRIWATSPRLPFQVSSRAPRGRTGILLFPKQACSHLHLCPMCCQSERQDLNLRSLGPQPSAMPDFATF